MNLLVLVLQGQQAAMSNKNNGQQQPGFFKILRDAISSMG